MPSFIIIGYVWEIFGREAFLPPPICEQPRKDSSWIELHMCSCSFFWVKVPSYVLICVKVFLESFQNCCFQECSVKLRDRSHMMSTHRSRGDSSVTFWFIWYFNQIYCFFSDIGGKVGSNFFIFGLIWYVNGPKLVTQFSISTMANVIRKLPRKNFRKCLSPTSTKLLLKRTEKRMEKLFVKIRKRELPQESKLKKVHNKWKRFWLWKMQNTWYDKRKIVALSLFI